MSGKTNHLAPCPPRAHRQRGMTLAELMIAIFLSTLIIMGAFHIQATFQYSLHRQDEITRIQQTMKVTRRMLERRIRAAGAGITTPAKQWCGGESSVGPFNYRNKNTFNVSDDVDGGDDDDPDRIEILSADRSKSGYLTKDHPVTGVVKTVDNPDNFAVGALMGIPGPDGICVFMVRDIKANKNLDYGTGSNPLMKCYNDKQNCRKEILGYNQLPAGTEILNFSSGTFALRIDDSQPARPVLMMATGVAGGDQSLYSWQAVAENVEDMQVGVYLDTSNPADKFGDTWVNSRDLKEAELNKVRAVRISLVFRSASELPGWTSGRRPALEDRPAATTTDGYLRRVLTTTVKLRNMPSE